MNRWMQYYHNFKFTFGTRGEEKKFQIAQPRGFEHGD